MGVGEKDSPPPEVIVGVGTKFSAAGSKGVRPQRLAIFAIFQLK